ncbi:hypothetical protein [Paenibacillus alginolyticus]|uniref:hypothetical protein n=1 Tax=Paenibacillus alginolyticus TaxID=59839 RepID=UPI0028AF5D07|nr:hypothetical protein [Paenibacillus frigoriresistens]
MSDDGDGCTEENKLLAAEKWSSWAELRTGQAYPTDFHRAWKNVLFNQFHDILAGTSLESAYEDARNMHGEAMTIAERGLNYAIQSISWHIGIEQEDGMKPIVVFNPHAWESTVNIELEIGGIKDTTILVDENGRCTSNWCNLRQRLAADIVLALLPSCRPWGTGFIRC